MGLSPLGKINIGLPFLAKKDEDSDFFVDVKKKKTPEAGATPANSATTQSEPTKAPTAVPAPKAEATPKPKKEATAVPTPKAEATPKPKKEATAVPTPKAEATPKPKAEPTAVPTPKAVPTAVPTAAGSAAYDPFNEGAGAAPTPAATAAATPKPKAEPTKAPTAAPTAGTTDPFTSGTTPAPTAQPTAVPATDQTVTANTLGNTNVETEGVAQALIGYNDKKAMDDLKTKTADALSEFQLGRLQLRNNLLIQSRDNMVDLVDGSKMTTRKGETFSLMRLTKSFTTPYLYLYSGNYNLDVTEQITAYSQGNAFNRPIDLVDMQPGQDTDPLSAGFGNYIDPGLDSKRPWQSTLYDGNRPVFTTRKDERSLTESGLKFVHPGFAVADWLQIGGGLDIKTRAYHDTDSVMFKYYAWMNQYTPKSVRDLNGTEHVASDFSDIDQQSLNFNIGIPMIATHDWLSWMSPVLNKVNLGYEGVRTHEGITTYPHYQIDPTDNKLKSPEAKDDMSTLMHTLSVGGNMRTIGLGDWPWDTYLGLGATYSKSTLNRFGLPHRYRPLATNYYPPTFYKDIPLSPAQQQMNLNDHNAFLNMTGAMEDLSAERIDLRLTWSIPGIMQPISLLGLVDPAIYPPSESKSLPIDISASYSIDMNNTIKMSDNGLNPSNVEVARDWHVDGSGNYVPIGQHFSESLGAYNGTTKEIRFRHQMRWGHLANMNGLMDAGYLRDANWTWYNALPKVAWIPASIVMRLPLVNVGLKDLLLLADNGQDGTMPIYIGLNGSASEENYSVRNMNTLEMENKTGRANTFGVNLTIKENLTFGWTRGWADNGYNFRNTSDFFYFQWNLYNYKGEM